jgi:hypothetical protein
VNEILSFREKLAARRARAARMFTLARIDVRRLVRLDKGPHKRDELRPTRPVARAEDARLAPVAQRTALVEKWARRVRRAGKVRLFRLWKIFGQKVRPDGPTALDALNDELTRPLGERLACLRRSRRL